MLIPAPAESEVHVKKTINTGAVIGGTIGAALVASTLFVFLLCTCRNRQALLQRTMAQGDIAKPLSSESEVHHRVGALNAPITPYLKKAISRVPDKSSPGFDRKMRSLADVTLRYPDPDSKNHSLSPWHTNLEETSQQHKPQIRPCTEGNGDQVEVLHTEHLAAESSLQSAKLHEDEEILQPDPITYRHQDSGWRVELSRAGRNETVKSRGAIELPPDYSEV